MRPGFNGRSESAAASIASLWGNDLPTPGVGVILGSGLSSIADTIGGREIPYNRITEFPAPTVAGHRGTLFLSGKAAVMAGRFHFYEGHPIDDIVLPVAVLRKLGVHTLIVTNASGGINRSYRPGELVLIRDHINLLGVNPLCGPNDDSLGPRFSDMTEAYSGELRVLARETSKLDLAEGVYAALLGPSYETPAEIGMLAAIGADLVGMSTVPEVILARYLGMHVLGISCVTNLASGLGEGALDHTEVVATGKRVEQSLGSLIHAVIDRLEVRES